MGEINAPAASVRCARTNITRGSQQDGRLLDMGQWRVQPRACCSSDRIRPQPAFQEMARHEQKQHGPNKASSFAALRTSAESGDRPSRVWILWLAATRTVDARHATNSRRCVWHRLLDVLGTIAFRSHAQPPFRLWRNQAITSTPAMPLLQRRSTSQPVSTHPSRHCLQRLSIAQAAPSTTKLSALIIDFTCDGVVMAEIDRLTRRDSPRHSAVPAVLAGQALAICRANHSGATTGVEHPTYALCERSFWGLAQSLGTSNCSQPTAQHRWRPPTS